MAACMAMLLCAGMPAQVDAQDLQPGGGSENAQSDTTSQSGDTSVSGQGPSAATGEVKVELAESGVGGVVRPGDWCGLRLRLTDTASTQREVLVRIHGSDPDGDIPLYQREQTTNPGTRQDVWLYPRLSFKLARGMSLTVTVNESIEGEGPDSLNGRRPGRLLARAQITLQGVVPPQSGLIGVVYQQQVSRTLGLSGYMGSKLHTSNETWHTYGHERSAMAELGPADLPDRWMGLAPMDALVWAGGDPAELRGDRDRSVREWVERGGHLIVVLPAVGQTWSSATTNQLYDMMPVVAISREENVPMADYRPLLTNRARAMFPTTGVVHSFKPMAEAKPNEAIPILNGPDGRCVVVRRLVGAGAVTWIGLDLNTTILAQGSSIDADVFWNRVLGKRMATTDPEDEKTTGDALIRMGLLNRQGVLFDEAIPGAINRKGSVALGILGAFGLFVLYWLIAGPLGFALLKRQNWQRHAWLAFVAAATGFTLISWGSATTLRPHNIDALHLTLLDHVYGQPIQRARMWASVLVPGYGTGTIAIGDRDATAGRSLNAVTVWDSSSDEASGWGGFPDARGYPVDTRVPDRWTFPTRATVKQIQADWAGGPVWKMPVPLGAGDEGVGQLTINPASAVQRGEPYVTGVLKHEMPGSLRNVVVVAVRGQTDLQPSRTRMTTLSQQLLANAYAWAITNEWRPGESLDLSIITQSRVTDADGRVVPARIPLLETYLLGQVPALQAYQWSTGGNPDPYTAEKKLRSLAFFNHLPPPTPDSSNQSYAAQRTSTHGWDLGLWLTQPCIIVIGDVDGVDSPVPLQIDGEPVPSRRESRVMVRWVYPLSANPPGHPKLLETNETPTGASGAETGDGTGATPPTDGGN